MHMPQLPKDLQKEIIQAYQPGVTSLRELARRFGTTHSTVQKVLNRNGIKTLSKRENSYLSMLVNLRYDVSLSWLMKYDNLEKIRILNTFVKRKGTNRQPFNLTTDQYIAYIERFYWCPQFDLVYSRWLKSGKDPLMAPSLDHIHPVSKGGSLRDIDNLQIISALSNRIKWDLLPDEWQKVKANIQDYLV